MVASAFLIGLAIGVMTRISGLFGPDADVSMGDCGKDGQSEGCKGLVVIDGLVVTEGDVVVNSCDAAMITMFSLCLRVFVRALRNYIGET